jgi:hypothetical protein
MNNNGSIWNSFMSLDRIQAAYGICVLYDNYRRVRNDEK